MDDTVAPARPPWLRAFSAATRMRWRALLPHDAVPCHAVVVYGLPVSRVRTCALIGIVLFVAACTKKTEEPPPEPAVARQPPPVVAPKPAMVIFRADELPPLAVRYAAADAPEFRFGPGRSYALVDGVMIERGQRLFVVDETSEWIRVRLSTEPAPGIGWLNRFASLPPLEADTNVVAQETDVALLRSVGMLQEVRVEMNQALINTNVWNDEDLAVRRGVGRTLAFYCGLKKGTNTRWVHLLDANSGQRLARYSENTGYTDFSSLRKTSVR